MTFSILARDPDTGELGGAAATGSLCVGGWVLRGTAAAGLSASQGAAPSTLWGEAAIDRLQRGESPEHIVDALTADDSGREWRQLSVLDRDGHSAVFNGRRNTPIIRSTRFDGGVACGNMLGHDDVIEHMVEHFLSSKRPFAQRLLESLRAADRSGGDMRGLQSAALLIVADDHAPITLRIDDSEKPLDDLEALYGKATEGHYADWFENVPTLNDPCRRLR